MSLRAQEEPHSCSSPWSRSPSLQPWENGGSLVVPASLRLPTSMWCFVLAVLATRPILGQAVYSISAPADMGLRIRLATRGSLPCLRHTLPRELPPELNLSLNKNVGIVPSIFFYPYQSSYLRFHICVWGHLPTHHYLFFVSDIFFYTWIHCYVFLKLKDIVIVFLTLTWHFMFLNCSVIVFKVFLNRNQSPRHYIHI